MSDPAPAAATKRCPKCKTHRPVTDFHVANKRPDGRASTCKFCIASTYKRDIRYVRERQRAAVKRNIAWLRRYLEVRACQCCQREGLDPMVLRLQHKASVGTRGIRYAVFYGLSIAACEHHAAQCFVICDDCWVAAHREGRAGKASPLRNSYATLSDKRMLVKNAPDQDASDTEAG